MLISNRAATLKARIEKLSSLRAHFYPSLRGSWGLVLPLPRPGGDFPPALMAGGLALWQDVRTFSLPKIQNIPATLATWKLEAVQCHHRTRAKPLVFCRWRGVHRQWHTRCTDHCEPPAQQDRQTTTQFHEDASEGSELQYVRPPPFCASTAAVPKGQAKQRFKAPPPPPRAETSPCVRAMHRTAKRDI